MNHFPYGSALSHVKQHSYGLIHPRLLLCKGLVEMRVVCDDWPLPCAVDPDPGGAGGWGRGDPGGEAGQDAAAHGVLAALAAAPPGRSGAPSRPLPGQYC